MISWLLQLVMIKYSQLQRQWCTFYYLSTWQEVPIYLQLQVSFYSHVYFQLYYCVFSLAAHRFRINHRIQWDIIRSCRISSSMVSRHFPHTCSISVNRASLHTGGSKFENRSTMSSLICLCFPMACISMCGTMLLSWLFSIGSGYYCQLCNWQNVYHKETEICASSDSQISFYQKLPFT